MIQCVVAMKEIRSNFWNACLQFSITNVLAYKLLSTIFQGVDVG